MKQHSARLERNTVGWEPKHSSLAEERLLWRCNWVGLTSKRIFRSEFMSVHLPLCAVMKKSSRRF